MSSHHVTRYAFDLDGTLCETEGMAYGEAVPIPERVELVRKLHREGAYIIIHTARGQSMTPANRRELLRMTRRQLTSWGVRYHELRPKPFAHYYVDDRAIFSEHFFASTTTGRGH